MQRGAPTTFTARVRKQARPDFHCHKDYSSTEFCRPIYESEGDNAVRFGDRVFIHKSAANGLTRQAALDDCVQNYNGRLVKIDDPHIVEDIMYLRECAEPINFGGWLWVV